jgi:regulation of enolase protein 1 (concanavalin A-like superfamily)
LSEKKPFEGFDGPALHKDLRWRCPPSTWSLEGSRLVVFPDAKTDYWQKTHYGFEADNGHFLFVACADDFTLSTRVKVFPLHQYDQAGLMVRVSPQCWLKTSVEFEPDGPSRLGAVVTNHGYSDWSTQDLPGSANERAFRITRTRGDFLVEFSERTGPDGESGDWTQIRLAHLHIPDGMPVECGLYACSPKEAGFRAEFDFLRLSRKGPEPR